MIKKALFIFSLSFALITTSFLNVFATNDKNGYFPHRDLTKQYYDNYKPICQEAKNNYNKYKLVGEIISIESNSKNNDLLDNNKLITIKTAEGNHDVLISTVDSKVKIIGEDMNLRVGQKVVVLCENPSEKTDIFKANFIMILSPKSITEKKEDTFQLVKYKTTVNPSKEKGLESWVNSRRKFKGIYTKEINNKTYILIAAGTCNTGGYRVQVNKVFTKSDQKNELYVDSSLITPSKDSIVTMAITYPYALIEVEGSYYKIHSLYKIDTINFNKPIKEFPIPIEENKVPIENLNTNLTLKEIKTRLDACETSKEKSIMIYEVLKYLYE